MPATNGTANNGTHGRIVPEGRHVVLAGRGSTYVRETGPHDAPTVVLLHGWCATGALNWFRAFGPLSEHFHVVAPDLRGHGRGVRSGRVFRLHDAADDVAELLGTLGRGPVVAVGYSMGGPVAQLLWKRHRDLVGGLVLCATAARFTGGGRERVLAGVVAGAAIGGSRLGDLAGRLAPNHSWAGLARHMRTGTTLDWATAELRRHDLRHLVEAGHSLGTYDARRWIAEIDVPTAALLTATDRAVPAHRQVEMAAAISGATLHTIADGHLACVNPAFGTAVLDAVSEVARRAGRSAHRSDNGPARLAGAPAHAL